jgi:ribosomal protein S10
MNYSTAVFLINDKVRAIAATYEKEGFEDNRPSPGPAKRIIFKTFDQSIQKDDLIVVPTKTRHGFTICKVVDVDLEIDLEAPTHIDWVAGVFEDSEHKRMLAMESTMVETIRSAEKNRKREELRKSLMADSESKLLALPISSVKDVE